MLVKCAVTTAARAKSVKADAVKRAKMAKDGKALGSPGKPDFQGEAHKLYMQHGKVHSNSVSQ